MKRLRFKCLIILVFIFQAIYAIENEKFKEKPRSKRSLASLLDAYIGGLRITGLRFQFFPEKIFFETFGDHEKVRFS